MQLFLGAPVAFAVCAGAELGLFALLAEEPLSAVELSRILDGRGDRVPPGELYRLLRGLSAVGVVDEHLDQRFSLTRCGELLRPDQPGSFDPVARCVGSEWLGGAFFGMGRALRSGQSAFTLRHGRGLFDWLAHRPELETLFARAMATLSHTETDALLEAYDFSEARHIVDVGGGHGALLWTVLSHAPLARGTLFDVPSVIEQARPPAALAERVTLVGGDFFLTVAEGGDLYLLKHVLHDFSEQRTVAILRNVAQAAAPGARVLVLEQGIAPPGVPNFGKVMDLILLTLLDGGRERTVDQHAVLMSAAGLQLERAIPTAGPLTIFVGRKPE